MSVFIGSDAPAPAGGPTTSLYAWANGDWERDTSIPDDEDRTGAWAEAERARRERLRRIIVSDARLKTLLDAGVRREDINALHVRALALTPSAWAARLARLRELGVEVFWHAEVVADTRHPDRAYALQLSEGGMSLPDASMYDTHGAGLERCMRALLSMCAFDPECATGAMTVERALASASAGHGARRTRPPPAWVQSSKMPACASLRWETYLARAGSVNAHGALVPNVAFLQAACEAIAGPHADAYVTWRIACELAEVSSGPTHGVYWDFFRRTIAGGGSPHDGERRTIDEMCALFPEAVSDAFVNDDRDAHRQRARVAEEASERVRVALRKRIALSDTFSVAFKAICVKKLESLIVRAGTAAAWSSGSEDAIAAALLACKHSSWFLVRAAAIRAEVRRQGQRIGTAGPRDAWPLEIPPHMHNACYVPAANAIFLPAAMLASPLFDVRPVFSEESVRACLETFGIVIAHEISHGLDDNGRRYGHNGGYVGEDGGWPVADAALYAKRCAAYDVQLLAADLDPKLTRGEMLADLVGMEAVLDALPASSHSGFFERWARMWRLKLRDASATLHARTNPHATGRTRVDVPVRNFAAFHAAFGVSAGDSMWLPPDARVCVFPRAQAPP